MNKELLAELYTLRAGLSTISLKKDKLEVEKEELKRSKNALSNRTSEELKLAKLKHDFNILENIQVDKSHYNKIDLTKLVMYLVYIGIFFSMLLPFYVLNENESTIKKWVPAFIFNKGYFAQLFFLILLPFFLVLLIAVIILIVESKIRKNRNNKFYLSELDKINKEKARLKILIEKEEKIVEREKTEQKEFKEQQRLNYLTMKNEYENNSNLIISSAKDTYSKLVDKFKNMLDVRDWQYLDLIIYYIETGRADSIKEALLQVDRKMQMNMIVEAIANAATKITETINASLLSIQNEININFKNLSELLTKNHNEQMCAIVSIENDLFQTNLNISKMANNIDNCGKYIKRLSTYDGLYDALIAKLNVNSYKIIDDVNFMINYVDTTYRKIN